jgi:DUF1365 family protein
VTVVLPTPSAVPAGGDGLRSAVYEGWLRHRRFGPGTTGEFSYRVAMPMLFLDEIDSVLAMHPLWSRRLPAPVRFRRDDFMGDPRAPLEQVVLDRVEEALGRRPEGPVGLLANVRTWGFLFNPISLYYCTGAGGGAVEALVAEVENTPWHERCSYVVGPPGRHRFAKALHVSPFLPMGVDYELRYSVPGESLAVRLDVLRAEEPLMSATLSLRRRLLDRRALGRLIWAHPAITHRVSVGIYAQAARLRLRGARFHAHPAKRPTKRSQSRPSSGP